MKYYWSNFARSVRIACGEAIHRVRCATSRISHKIVAILLTVGLVISLRHNLDLMMAVFLGDLTFTGIMVILVIAILCGHEMPPLLNNVVIVIDLIALAALTASSVLRKLIAVLEKIFGKEPDDTG